MTQTMRLHPGETAGSGWRTEELRTALDRLVSAAGEGPRPRVVAVDGRGGAGKSVLTARFADLTPNSAVVHTDDIAWHESCFDWGQLLVRNVLEPLRRGEAVSYRPGAWRERGRAGAIEVPAGLDVLWVEGTGIIRRELDPWIDASVYVQGDLTVQEQRLVARDGDTPEVREQVASWLAEEIPFLMREKPWEHATLLVDGTADAAGDQLVVAPPVQPTRG